MIDLKQLARLAILPLALISCKSEFEVLSSRTSYPANVKIDFKVNKPTKDIRPVRLTEDLYLDQIDLRKISITEDGYKLSMSEGGSASVTSCNDCSLNFTHLTFDYSGSVRNQFEVMKNSAINFIRTLDPKTSLVAMSFFAGEAGLYNLRGIEVFYQVTPGLLKRIENSTCADYLLNSDTSRNLCQADTATRLNTAILNNIAFVENADHPGKSVYRTSVIFTDGRGRDKGVTDEQVKASVAKFKSKGGLFYTVTMKSDEADRKFFESIEPTKNFKMTKVHQLSERLADVLDDVKSLTPLFFTLKICSATRGAGKAVLNVSSKKYDIEASTSYDTTDFGGGCDLKDPNQWRF